MDRGEALFLLARQVFPVLTVWMTEPSDTPPATAAPSSPALVRAPEQAAKTERANRLAKALRDNLRRRKTARPDRKDS